MQGTRSRLSYLWWIWSALLFLLVLTINLISGLDDAQTLWGWFLPNIAPILTLVSTMSGGGTTSRMNPADAARNRHLALGSSIFYLGLLTITVLLFFVRDIGPGQVIKSSGLWLAPVQAIASYAMSFYFSARSKDAA